MPFSVGDLIDDHYRVEQRFAGGMGFVYVVLDEVVRKRFAVKQLSELHAEDQVLRERFRREASTWLQLDYHPHIVQAHSYLPRPEGPMLILEFVDGPSLDLLLRTEKKLTAAQVVAYGRQFCLAMIHAHTKVIPDRGVGVLHRDIKPGNILLTRTNLLKVSDFGLAKIQGDANLTSEGQFVGTVAYSSPEQLRSASEVTKASDVYSFGAVLYQMLSGQPPFRAKNPAELYHAIQDLEPNPLTDRCAGINEGFAQVVMQCLKKDPQERIGDFKELEFALGGYDAVVRDRQDRVCASCGFISRRTATKCAVCGKIAERIAAKTSRPPPRTGPTKGWKCICGAIVSVADNACNICGRVREGSTPAKPESSPSLPVPADLEGPLPVPSLSDPSVVCTTEQKSSWNLDSDKEYLVELKAGGALLPWQLERSGYTLGRDPNMKIRLEDPSVARYQMFLVRLPCGWLAINPQPNSRMEVNGWTAKQRLLRAADLLRVGATWLTYSGPSGAFGPMSLVPGRWMDRVEPKDPTVNCAGSNPTKVESHPASACVLEIAGGQRFVARGQPLRIGTSPLCEVRLDDPSIAPVQVLLAWQSDGPHVMNVTNGPVRIVGDEILLDRLLQDGNLIQVGATPIRVRIEGDPLLPGRRSAASEAKASGRFALTILTGDQKGQTATLPTGEPVVLGRLSACDMILGSDAFVSRSHLQLVAGATDIDAKDLGGRSGFFVNQTHYADTAVVRLGDVLVVGKTSMLVHYELEAE